MAEKQKTASERMHREAPGGLGGEVLVAAPGDPIPDENDVPMPGGGLTMAPQQWDAEAREFSVSADDPNEDNVDALNEAQGAPGPAVREKRASSQASSGSSSGGNGS